MPKSHARFNRMKSVFFESAVNPIFATGETIDSNRRTFTGLAYSGAAVSDGYDPIVIDLASVRLPNPCPVLLQHNRDKRVGVCSLSVSGGGLACEGYLLGNTDASRIAEDSDDGFPWQLSIHAQPGTTEQIEPGMSTIVNGRNVQGPAVVFRNTSIRELSFTPTGVDSNTNARVWSDELIQLTGDYRMSEETISNPRDLESEIDALKESVASLTQQLSDASSRADSAEAALAANIREARLSSINTLFAKLGRVIDEPTIELYASLTDAAWSKVSTDLMAMKPQAPAHLFSEQAIGDVGDKSPNLSFSSIYAARRQGV